MANNRINRYIGAFALGTVLLVVPACTDTWDDHYNSNESVSGTTQTLWDVLNDPKNTQFSKFRDIVQNAKYYKDNTHPVSTYTYADILKGGQVNTLWVPDNDALTDAEYTKWMNMLTGDTRADDSNTKTAGYDVQQQFIGNHIALWRHNISDPGKDTVKMINGKNLEFDKTNKTLEGIPLGDYNIPTVNGVIHVLKGIAPFHYNFYEYLKYPEPGKSRTKLGEYVVGKDTTYFAAENSIEGLPDENGNPTYVDSVYYTTNRLFETRHYTPKEGEEKWQMTDNGFGARINNEDSVFIMILPTDAAWDAAYEMLKDSYKYATKYDDKKKGDNNNKTPINIDDPTPDQDSLQNMSLKMDLVSPLVFNLNKQPKVGGEMWTLKKFKELKGEGAEYLLNTYGDTLRAVGEWLPSSLFEGEPIEMSNGLAYEVSSLNFPKQYLTPDVEVEIEGANIFYNTEGNKGKRYVVGSNSKRYSFSNDLYSDITEIYGEVSNNNFYYLESSNGKSPAKVEIKLKGNTASAYVPNAQVMSGTYDVQIVVVPYWYLDIARASEIGSEFYENEVDTIVNPEDETDTTFVYVPIRINQSYIEDIAKIRKYKFKATLSYNNNSTSDKTEVSKAFEYDGLKVDTITVLKDFKFPFSYKNMRYTYPTLFLESTTGSSDVKKGFLYDLVIDKIILKRKD